MYSIISCVNNLSFTQIAYYFVILFVNCQSSERFILCSDNMYGVTDLPFTVYQPIVVPVPDFSLPPAPTKMLHVISILSDRQCLAKPEPTHRYIRLT